MIGDILSPSCTFSFKQTFFSEALHIPTVQVSHLIIPITKLCVIPSQTGADLNDILLKFWQNIRTAQQGGQVP